MRPNNRSCSPFLKLAHFVLPLFLLAFFLLPLLATTTFAAEPSAPQPRDEPNEGPYYRILRSPILINQQARGILGHGCLQRLQCMQGSSGISGSPSSSNVAPGGPSVLVGPSVPESGRVASPGTTQNLSYPVQAVYRTPYAYGWFGAQPDAKWSRHYGYYRNYTQWKRH